MSETSERKTKRRNLALPPHSQRSIAEIRKYTGAATDTEAIRNALRMYERVLREVGPDGEIELRRKDGEAALTLMVS